MKKGLRKLLLNNDIEEKIFSIVLLCGLPFFILNIFSEILVDINVIRVGVLITLLFIDFLILYLILFKNQRLKSLIPVFTILVAVGFGLFWPNSSGIPGGAAYIFYTVIILLLLTTRGFMKAIFGLLLTAFIIANFLGYLPTTGKIFYNSLVFDFIINLLIIFAILSLFKSAMHREQKKLKRRIGILDQLNEELEKKTETLEKNKTQILKIQTDLQGVIKDRTEEYEQANEKMIEYAFINAHLVRAPLANIIGLSEILSDQRKEFKRLNNRIKEMDKVVRKIGGVLAISENKRQS